MVSPLYLVLRPKPIFTEPTWIENKSSSWVPTTPLVASLPCTRTIRRVEPSDRALSILDIELIVF